MMNEDYELVIKPVLNKHNTFLEIKKDRRKRERPVWIEFKIDGGTISGLFELKRLKTTTKTYDAMTGDSVPCKHEVAFND